MSNPRPVILLTVHRRYHELARALDNLWDHVAEFGDMVPEVYVVWSCPEVSRIWFFRELARAKKIHRLIGRPKLAGESPLSSTTYPESYNISIGLMTIGQCYRKGYAYIIVQAADVIPRPGIYATIHNTMITGAPAFLFHWENGCAQHGVWHTNFFAVSLDERYWPPVSAPNHPDVLERQWGTALQKASLHIPDECKSTNYNSKRFVHEHLTERLPPFPSGKENHRSGLSVFLRGRKSPWRRFLAWLDFDF